MVVCEAIRQFIVLASIPTLPVKEEPISLHLLSAVSKQTSDESAQATAVLLVESVDESKARHFPFESRPTLFL